jgi:hypothetical protein
MALTKLDAGETTEAKEAANENMREDMEFAQERLQRMRDRFG